MTEISILDLMTYIETKEDDPATRWHMLRELIEKQDTQRGLTPDAPDQPLTCPSCGGKGSLYDGFIKRNLVCLDCNGSGQVKSAVGG